MRTSRRRSRPTRRCRGERPRSGDARGRPRPRARARSAGIPPDRIAVHGERRRRRASDVRGRRGGRCVCHPCRRGPDARRRSRAALRRAPGRGEPTMSVVRADESVPDERGRFGDLRRALRARGADPGARRARRTPGRALRDDPGFRAEFGALLPRLRRPPDAHHPRGAASRRSSGYDIWLKREDLAHTGAHKINNALGQALVAKRLGKERIIAETGAGQHGVATATACALARPAVRGLHGRGGHAPAGAERRPDEAPRRRGRAGDGRHAHVEGGRQRGVAGLGRERPRRRTTSSARSSGPHPFPMLVRDLQRVIGDEARGQYAERPGGDPEVVRAPASAAAATRSACSRPSSARPASG